MLGQDGEQPMVKAPAAQLKTLARQQQKLESV